MSSSSSLGKTFESNLVNKQGSGLSSFLAQSAFIFHICLYRLLEGWSCTLYFILSLKKKNKARISWLFLKISLEHVASSMQRPQHILKHE